jgi:uncharacterized repeat protein (TIGR01451 family)
VRIVARVGEDRAGAVLVNDATIAPGNQKDPNHADNTGSATVKVTSTSDSKAKLAIAGTTTPTWSWIHSTVQVSFTVTNISDKPANSLQVCVTVPPGLAYVRSAGRRTGSKVCFSRSQLASQESATFTYTARGSVVGPWRARAMAAAGNASQVGAATNLGVLGPSGGVTG